MPTARVTAVLAAGLIAAILATPAAASRPNPHAALDCSYCHDAVPTFGVDTKGTVNFWRAEGDEPALCLRCHEPEENLHPIGAKPGPLCLDTVCPVGLPLGSSESVAGQVVCTTCHFLHAANADNALLRGFPGSSRPRLFRTWQDLCRQCHLDSLGDRTPHTGDERACAFCHSSKPKPGEKVTLTAQGRRLCEFCHGRMDEKHYAGVNPYPEKRDCVGCHDPHLGEDHPARLRPGYFDPIRDNVTLNPHRKRTLCFACHPDGPAGKQLRSTEPVVLCQRCHGSGAIPGMSHPMTNVPEGMKIPEGWPLAGTRITCLTCHLPGHLDEDRSRPNLLRGGSAADRNEVCFACHDPKRWEGKNPHREVAQERTGCETCHVKKPVWGFNLPQDIAFRADINILCLACHDPAPHPGGFWHTMTLTGDMPQPDSALPLGLGRRITCATCHNPHRDRGDGFNLRGVKEPVPFCARCHKIGAY